MGSGVRLLVLVTHTNTMSKLFYPWRPGLGTSTFSSFPPRATVLTVLRMKYSTQGHLSNTPFRPAGSRATTSQLQQESVTPWKRPAHPHFLKPQPEWLLTLPPPLSLAMTPWKLAWNPLAQQVLLGRGLLQNWSPEVPGM